MRLRSVKFSTECPPATVDLEVYFLSKVYKPMYKIRQGSVFTVKWFFKYDS